MSRRCLVLLAMTPLTAIAQSNCPQVNFLTARSVNLKPSATSHIDVVRQADGSYTGFEVADAAPYRTIAVTPHFEQQFAACLPHTIPASPSTAPVIANPPGAGSQMQVSETLANGNTFVARISTDSLQYTVFFDIFDSQHNLLSENPFTSVVSPPGYVGSANESFHSLALADLNGDGKLDLLAVFDTPTAHSISYGGVWTFLGNGDGTFQPGNRQVLSSVGMVMAAVAIAVGDLNGDGKPDLVLGRQDSAAFLMVAFGNGDGTFNTQAQFVSSACAPTAAIADLNGDGKGDLVVGPCPSQPSVQVLLGNGNGTFQAASYYAALMPVNALAPYVPVAVGDVNGDGIPDIVSAGGSILFGDGKGNFPSRRDYAQTTGDSVMLADFDGDGKTDIIFGAGNPAFLSGRTNDPSLTVMFASGGGAFVGAPVSSVGTSGTLTATADFNGDGIPDLAVGSGTAFSILLGQGQGQFTPAFTKTFGSGNSVASIAAGDFNRDGKPDLAVLSRAAGQIEIYPGVGDGTLAAPYVVPMPSGSQPDFLAASDVNGDGVPDLVVAAGNTLILCIANGDGTFAAPVSVQQPNAPASSEEAIAFGDFNGDGKLDIAVTSDGTSTVNVMLGKGDGTFPASIATQLPCQARGVPGAIAAADFNGDGRLDLAVACNADSNPYIATLLGQGNGQFSQASLSQGSLSAFYVADVNGDKIPDLISGSGTSAGLTVWLGDGYGTFGNGVVIFPYSGILAVADFNRDGTPDAALVFPAFGIVGLLNLSQAPPPLTVVSAATFLPGPLAPDSFATAFGEIIPPGSGSPIPLTAAVIGVTLQDSSGANYSPSLFYFSSTQINFLVPASTALGPATLTVIAGGRQLSAQVQIAAIAPSLFMVGSGIAAAYAIQVAPGGAQTVEPVFTDQSGVITATPLSVNQPGQVYLTLFGTGFDAAGASSILATVQGISVPVTYGGPQPTSSGLDQINLLLPSSLAGTGVASVAISVAGTACNPVYVTIQ